MDYSVLMSVYKSEKAEYLRIAMNSMWNQTVPTNDFVLMCDGPLTDELDAVIEEMQSEHPELHVIRFEKNGGLGHALQVGVKECKNDLIARMDSDDISRPERCEKELAVFADHPELSIVGSVIEEFTEIEAGATVPTAINAKRVVPEKSEDIITFAKQRNPFNHPSVMYKKDDVLAAGNYQDVRYMQDVQHPTITAEQLTDAMLDSVSGMEGATPEALEQLRSGLLGILQSAAEQENAHEADE